MVRRDGPTDGASATVRQHERQLPLLLDLFHNQSHNQVQMDMCDLLLADRGRDVAAGEGLVGLVGARFLRDHTSLLVGDVQNNMVSHHSSTTRLGCCCCCCCC